MLIKEVGMRERRGQSIGYPIRERLRSMQELDLRMGRGSVERRDPDLLMYLRVVKVAVRMPSVCVF